MARLTFESVKQYAEDCGYTLLKASEIFGNNPNTAKGYSLSTPAHDCNGNYKTLKAVIEAINSGELLIPERHSSELPQNDIQSIEQGAQIKCIYPNCPNPCHYDCDHSELIDKELFSQSLDESHISIEGVLGEIGVATEIKSLDIAQHLQHEVTKQRVIDICNNHLVFDYKLKSTTPTWLAISRISSVLWRKSMRLSNFWLENTKELSDWEFWKLALKLLLEAGF